MMFDLYKDQRGELQAQKHTFYASGETGKAAHPPTATTNMTGRKKHCSEFCT